MWSGICMQPENVASFEFYEKESQIDQHEKISFKQICVDLAVS